MTERSIYIDINAQTPEELADKTSRAGVILSELGITHKTLAGQELVDVALNPDDPNVTHFELKD